MPLGFLYFILVPLKEEKSALRALRIFDFIMVPIREEESALRAFRNLT